MEANIKIPKIQSQKNLVNPPTIVCHLTTMSMPNSPIIPGSTEQLFGPKNSRPRLRNVRLELPTVDFPRRIAGSPQIYPGSPQSGSFGSQPPMQNSSVIQRNTVTSLIRGGTLSTPTINYRFTANPEPSLVLDIVSSNVSHPFTTNPGLGVVNPRFLLYTVCSTSISTTPVKIVLNGTTLFHWMTNPRPMDVTDVLVSFGQQNWIIVETGAFSAPFSIIGIWTSYFTMTDIINEISNREKFPYNEASSIDPITGQQIDIPARGVNCTHDQCFDCITYITVSQASGQWLCPICQQFVTYNDLRVGQLLEGSPLHEDVSGLTWNEGEITGFGDGDPSDMWFDQ